MKNLELNKAYLVPDKNRPNLAGGIGILTSVKGNTAYFKDVKLLHFRNEEIIDTIGDQEYNLNDVTKVNTNNGVEERLTGALPLYFAGLSSGLNLNDIANAEIKARYMKGNDKFIRVKDLNKEIASLEEEIENHYKIIDTIQEKTDDLLDIIHKYAV